MKKAFTLIELLVVIGIIAILIGVLLGTFGKASESAQSAVCLTNMKNLSTAVRAMGGVPSAVSYEYPYVTSARGNHFDHIYFENPGWISWYSKGLYYKDDAGRWRANSSQAASCHEVGMYSTDYKEVQYALSHGSLYSHLSGNASCYVCPLHKRLFPAANWSYFLHFAGWADDSKTKAIEVKLGAKNPDRKLLFGEIPFRKGSPGDWFPEGEAATEETDAALQLDGDKPENIGANHKIGKDWVAHVSFMDGHVEKLRIGRSMSPDNLRELTRLLVDGEDITFNAKAQKYEKIQ